MNEIVVEYRSLDHKLEVEHLGLEASNMETPVAIRISGLPDSCILNGIICCIKLMLSGGRTLARIEVDGRKAKEIVELLGISRAYGIPVVHRTSVSHALM